MNLAHLDRMLFRKSTTIVDVAADSESVKPNGCNSGTMVRGIFLRFFKKKRDLILYILID
ncbi:hypothetical protein [Paraliobacillus zengyii]|uniref:hypothetical protein n=1 Tax=Paraliobacillus zengyii TaxID=2213194 RepID=UPI000DD345F6|nr:hypothetical protein [Paraliobacillus zengyii]